MNDGEAYRTILGIRFFAGDAREAVRLGMRGGLVTVPAAPLLVTMRRDTATREALMHSAMAITDSGFMVLLWNLLERDHIPRVSGLEYLKLLLEEPDLRMPGAVFWIMPTEEALERNLRWLQAAGHPATRDDCYLAPHYGKGAIADPALMQIISGRKPGHIILAIGGGAQERLGYYIQENASYRPAIHCIGAAIGFLSGDQVKIPEWADRWMLGWLLRCLSAPGKFIPRYWKALGLLPLMWKYRKTVPPIR